MRRKRNGFTLLEVMIAIFVFSSGMMAFMSYHARANTMIFETESSQIAHSIAINLAQEVSSMTPERLRQLCDVSGITYGAIYQDANLAHYFDQGGEFATGPFDSWGQPLNGSNTGTYLFYRMIKINTYDDITDTSNPTASQLARLRHLEVIVSWPLKGHGSVKCNSVAKPECNYLIIPIVKGVAIEP